MDEKEGSPWMAAYCLDIISATMERTIRRLWALCIILALLLAGSWAGFLWYLNQYDFAGYEYTQDGQGVNIIGDSNGVDYGPTIESPKAD